MRSPRPSAGGQARRDARREPDTVGAWLACPAAHLARPRAARGDRSPRSSASSEAPVLSFSCLLFDKRAP